MNPRASGVPGRRSGRALRGLAGGLVLTLLGGLAGCADQSTGARSDAARAPGDAGLDRGPEAPTSGAPAPLPGHLPALVLGAWSGAADALWFVGGERGSAGGLVARLSGDQVVRVATPPGPTLWWIWGAPDGTRYAVGQAGRLLRSDTEGGAWRAEATGLPESAVLWGVWGSSGADLWAVGGSPRGDGPKGVVLRSQGDGRWTRLEHPALPTAHNLYKVWGAGPDDVHLVGENGLAFHWDGRDLRPVPTPTTDLIFTVHGQPGGPVLAVGGTATGLILAFVEGAWRAEAAPAGPALNGVHVRPDGTAIAVGARGVILARDRAGTWTRVRTELPDSAGDDVLHAVTSDARGALWAVGGDFASAARGTILTTRRPLPTVAWQPAPPIPTDLGIPDAATDAERDGGGDAGVGPGPADLGHLDGGLDATPGADLAPPPDDGPPPDAAQALDLAPVADAEGSCGDGTRNAGEACDDGNLLPDDGCDPLCQVECGNGRLDGPETCDDGNTEGGDGCDARCTRECGNGRLDGPETCDDGNLVPGDGCDPLCQLECGNGRLDGPETCDDGNLDPGDGCDPTCRRECGNGRLDGPETCDDGNRFPGDGCDQTCQLECGNGRLDGLEACDDGNLDAGDGCDPGCRVELPGAGEPCLGFRCADDLECWGIAQSGFRNVCSRPCVTVADCEPAFGPVCCQRPGPQVIETYCVSRTWLPNGCDGPGA